MGLRDGLQIKDLGQGGREATYYLEYGVSIRERLSWLAASLSC